MTEREVIRMERTALNTFKYLVEWVEDGEVMRTHFFGKDELDVMKQFAHHCEVIDQLREDRSKTIWRKQ